LTNYSINKLSPLFVQNKDGKDAAKDGEDGEGAEEGGDMASKWSFKELRDYFKQQGLDYDALFARINDLAIKTLIAVEPQMRAEWSRSLGNEAAGWEARGKAGSHSASCFETYGFDVLIDQELKPWLLEVNICPSMSSGSPLDKRIKTKLTADVLTLVGIQPLPAVARSNKRTSSGEIQDSTIASMPSTEELRIRKIKLSTASAKDAVASFDEFAWDIVMKAHDEDMRSGGLERIFPNAASEQYAQYFQDGESYANLVLRKWHEAGGGNLFGLSDSHSPVPHWVPRQVCFSST